jgi:alpha-galactosidase
MAAVTALDLTVDTGGPGPVEVHHARGSQAHESDFEPLLTPLEAGSRLHLRSAGVPTCADGSGGSPSVEALPFFLAALPAGGLTVALGWTGPWRAEIHRSEPALLHLSAAMEGVHLRLQPGEEIRGPRVLVQWWRGSVERSTAMWRRLLLAHYSPCPDGRPFAGLLCDSLWGAWTDGDGHVAEIERWAATALPVECYWMDAGWSGDMRLGWAAHQSDRRPDTRLFPRGVRPVADAAHRHGIRFLLWFVPESIQPGVELGAWHPDWVLEPFRHAAYGDNVFYGIDHGNPAVNTALVDYCTAVVREHGVDVFRQDGLSLWPRDVDPERQGMSQIRYTEGFYAFWDGLLAQNPHLLIDNCGTGARKLDLETIRRSVVFWRSDCQASGTFDPIVSQDFTQGLSPWVPLFGAAVPMGQLSCYAFRSGYAPVLQLAWPAGNPAARWRDLDLPLLAALMREYLELRPLLWGDFYPLAPYSRCPGSWAAWQWHRADLNHGMVQLFRRQQCDSAQYVVRLRGLVPGALYQVSDRDQARTAVMSGDALMTAGIAVVLAHQPASALLEYRLAD